MVNINLKSIKKESVKSVFSVIAYGNNVSRAEISAQTGLSLMTVGKVVDMLSDKDVIIQVKEVKSEVGRRAGLVNLNLSKFMAIFDFSSYDFEMCIFDLALKQRDIYKHSYDQTLSYEENLVEFLKNSLHVINKQGSEADFVGSAVAIPGIYDNVNDRVINKRIPDLNTVSLKKKFIDILGSSPYLISENVKLGAAAHIFQNTEYMSKVVFYLHIGEGVSGALFIDGELVKGNGGFVGQVGQLKINPGKDGVSIEDYIKSGSFTKEQKSELLINVIHNIIWLLSPHIVILESDDEKYEITNEDIVNSFEFKQRDFPTVISTLTNIKNAYIGAGLALREKWMENELFGADSR